MFALATVLGIARRGFYIPHRYAGQIARPLPAYDAVARLFAASEPAFRRQLEVLDGLSADLLAISGGPPPAPRWDQDWFPPLDAAMLYGMVRHLAPARMVEVGSGHSTRFAARAIADGRLATRLVAIDPQPRRPLAGLAVQHLAAPVQEIGEAPFETLAAGDILFIDSSHILMPGTDLDHLVNRVLPLLPDGVVVHVHDVFLPDDYPADWVWRGYNEQQVVAALALIGGWRPVFASRYASTRMASAVARSPVGALLARHPAANAPSSSLWLVKGGTADLLDASIVK